METAVKDGKFYDSLNIRWIILSKIDVHMQSKCVVMNVNYHYRQIWPEEVIKKKANNVNVSLHLFSTI